MDIMGLDNNENKGEIDEERNEEPSRRGEHGGSGLLGRHRQGV
jgi:hypothetical protein